MHRRAEPWYPSGVSEGQQSSATADANAARQGATSATADANAAAQGATSAASSGAATAPLAQAAADDRERTLFEGHPAVLTSVVALLVSIVTLGLALIYYWIASRAIHVRITTQRIVLDRGILSKRMDQLDLYRVTDYVVERPLAQRMMGTGNLVLKAMDASTPELALRGLKTDVVALYESLRRATEDEKRRRGVRVVDYE